MASTVSTASSPEPGAFYEDLENLLKAEILRRPAQLDTYVKLAELYSQTRRSQDFVHNARQLRSLVKDPLQSDEWLRIAGMGRVLQPSEPLFSAARPDAIDFSAGQSMPEAQNHSRIGEDERFRKPLQALAAAYEEVRKDAGFLTALDIEMMQFAGHPSPLEPVRRLSEYLGGAQMFLKRNDIGARQSHITAAIVGQALLARRMGKKALVAASGNGHSGTLVASVAAKLGMSAIIFMAREQIQIHRSNVFRMRLCGADVQEIDPKQHATADIRQAAFDHWARFSNDKFLVLGLESGPHPYPMMMLEFTSFVGRECRRQLFAHLRKAPDVLVTRAGENADAIGLFPSFLKVPNTRLVCVGATDGFEAAASAAGPGMVEMPRSSQQSLTPREQQRSARILEGLEYPSVAREQAWLRATERVEYPKVSSSAARKAINELGRREGIIPAIETAYALAWACQTAAGMAKEQAIMVLFGENVEKDIWQIGRAMGVSL